MFSVQRPLFLLISILFLILLNAAQAEPITNSPPAKPLLLAFYHPWYGTPWGPTGKWNKWDSFKFPDRYHPERLTKAGRHDIASADYPLIGPYDTSDREIVRWHFRLAKAAGIDGFLCSWWNVGKPDSFWAHQYELFEKVWLPVAEEEHFKIGVLDECAHYVPDYGKLISRITNNLPRYAKSPAYLRVHGQPVWYVYQVWDDWLTPETASRYVNEAQRQVGDVYWIFDKLKAVPARSGKGIDLTVAPGWLAIKDIDCFGTYSLFGHCRETNADALEKLYVSFAQNIRHAGKQVELPILPGHDNTAVNEEPFVAARKNGALLKAFCRAVDAAKPDVAVVCSFNEWFEMTEVEPSSTWRDPYLYLKLLAQWRGKDWHEPPLPPAGSLDPARNK